MNASNASEHVLDNFPYEMGLAAKLVETAILPFLVGFTIGMYQGIEINHPGENCGKNKSSELRVTFTRTVQ
jgi:hypothetical protein